GSMNGAKIVQARRAALMALDRLESDDVLSIVTYSDRAEVLVPATRVRDRHVLRRKINHIFTSGRTALYAGTKAGIGQVREFLRSERVNRVILLSDGLANIGPSTPEALGRLGREAVADGISVTTIGLGLGYNEDLMAKLAYNSDGNHAFVEDASDLARIFDQEFGNVLSVVAQDIIIHIDIYAGFRPHRILGREAEINGNRIELKFNQIYGAQQKYVIVELDPASIGGSGSADLAKVTLSYRGQGSTRQTSLSENVSVSITDSESDMKRSINAAVMTDVTTQIAKEENERALRLRDKGKIKEASRILEDNAAYLGRAAKEYGSSALQDLSAANRKDARAVTRQHDWNKNRKSMKARQHKSKVQQTY
ncbi:MAG: vWA domain-containing protein, partial [Methyloligellaceae bacterium]